MRIVAIFITSVLLVRCTGRADSTFAPGYHIVDPQISFTRAVHPVLKPGETQTLEISPSLRGSATLSSMSYAVSTDGVTYGSETSISNSATSISWTVPANATSTTSARVRLTITNSDGAVTQTISDPFAIVTQMERIVGTGYAMGSATGVAPDNRIRAPYSVVADATYVYIGEAATIYRVAIATGELEFFVGLPVVEGNVDGVGPDARFRIPAQMTILGSYLYFVDSSSHVLRQVDIDPLSANYRRVVTVAGSAAVSGTTDGVGSNARFRTPSGLATDGTYLYVADFGNHSIRKVDVSTFTVSTFVGLSGTGGFVNNVAGAAARLFNPRKLAYSAGFLYVSEATNVTIRKIDVATATISNFFNNTRNHGAAEGTAATGKISSNVALAADASYLYLGDQLFHTVRKVDLATATSTLVAGSVGQTGSVNGVGAAARFSYIFDLFSSGGNVYVTDQRNASVRKVDVATNTVTTFAGGLGSADMDLSLSYFRGTQGKLMASYSVVTNDGNIFYLSQYQAHTIRKIDLSGGTITTIAGTLGTPGFTDGIGTNATFNQPHGLALEGTTLYVCDRSNHAIRAIDLNTNTVSTVAGSTAGTSGTQDDDGTAARFNRPTDIVSDGTYLWITDYSNHSIRRLTIGGLWTVTLMFGQTAVAATADGVGTAATFDGPRGIAISADRSTLYISDALDHVIRKAIIDSGSINYLDVSTLAGTAGSSGSANGIGTAATFSSPLGVAVNGSYLYVADNSNSRVRKVDTSTGEVSSFVGGSPVSWINVDGIGETVTMTQPAGLASFGSYIYVSSIDSAPFRRVDTATATVKTVAGYSSVMGTRNVGAHEDGNTMQLVSTYASVVTDGDYLYALDTYNFVVYRLDLDGTNETVVVGEVGSAGAVDGVGTNARIGSATHMVYADGFLYVADKHNQLIRRISTADFTVTSLAGSPAVAGTVDGTGTGARLDYPNRLAISGEDIYFSENSNTLRKLSLAPATLGQVTTLAGTVGTSGYLDGIGTAAQFSDITGIAIIGNYGYIAESPNSLIRKIDLTTLEVTTFLGTYGTYGVAAGTGSAVKLRKPDQIITDGRNLFFIDQMGALFKVDPETAIATIFAGGLERGKTGPTDDIDDAGFGTFSLSYHPNLGLLMAGEVSLLRVH
jgi:sugar lactone lactonase YvrE